MTHILSCQEIKNGLIQLIKQDDDFGKDQSNRIIKVINGYGKREGFFNKINGVFYRIWNAVKAIFGQSDWQLAKKTLIDAELKKSLNQIKNDITIPKKFKKRISEFLKSQTSFYSDTLLSVYIDCTHLKIRSDDDINSKITEIAEKYKKKGECLQKRQLKLQTEIKTYKKDQ
jgi:hypothetical protein